MFGVPVVAAIYNRKRPDWHKRLMLSATFGLLGAPILRLFLLTTNLDFDQPPIWAGAYRLILLAVFRLRPFHSRQHSSRLRYGLALFIVSQVVLMNLSAWGPWLLFSRRAQHLLG